jgi:hypothetical protein
MSKNNKILLGVLTFLPILGFILTIGFMFSAFTTIASSSGAPDAIALSGSIKSALFITMFFMILAVGLMIYYIIHAINIGLSH